MPVAMLCVWIALAVGSEGMRLEKMSGAGGAQAPYEATGEVVKALTWFKAEKVKNIAQDDAEKAEKEKAEADDEYQALIGAVDWFRKVVDGIVKKKAGQETEKVNEDIAEDWSVRLQVLDDKDWASLETLVREKATIEDEVSTLSEFMSLSKDWSDVAALFAEDSAEAENSLKAALERIELAIGDAKTAKDEWVRAAGVALEHAADVAAKSRWTEALEAKWTHVVDAAEVATTGVAFWPQYSGRCALDLRGTHRVKKDTRFACQAFAISNGDVYYSYKADTQSCKSNSACFEPTTARNPWELFMTDCGAYTKDSVCPKQHCTWEGTCKVTACTTSETIKSPAACKCASIATVNECGIGSFCYDGTCNKKAKALVTCSGPLLYEKIIENVRDIDTANAPGSIGNCGLANGPQCGSCLREEATQRADRVKLASEEPVKWAELAASAEMEAIQFAAKFAQLNEEWHKLDSKATEQFVTGGPTRNARIEAAEARSAANEKWKQAHGAKWDEAGAEAYANEARARDGAEE